MILNDPCFRKMPTPPPNVETRDGSPIAKKICNRVFLLTTCFKRAVVVAVSSDRAKRMMVEHTSMEDWGSAEDIEIIITGEEQIISESI